MTPVPPECPFGAVVARQVSVWPFGARTLRLFVLVDPSLPGQTPRRGLVRAMQEAYFRSDGFSQTRAVREAALAAHYVLRHHNRDVLPLDHVNAATAVAALRGDVAFVALAGDAAAFAWRDGSLTGQRGILRLPRPLGLEQDPRITVWSTPLQPGDRLVLVCGAIWRSESKPLIEAILSQADSQGEVAETRLAEALGGERPAGVLVLDPGRRTPLARHLMVVSTRELARGPSIAPQADHPAVTSRAFSRWLRRWVSPFVALVLLAAAAVAILNPAPTPARQAGAAQAEVQALLAEADRTTDIQQAHALVASALDLARSAPSNAPDDYGGLASQVASKLDSIDRVYPVNPAMAVRLGPSGKNVVDLAVGDDRLYTLDVVEASVRSFGLDARDQQPTPDTLLVRTGAPIGAGTRQLATPVAIQYLSRSRPELGVLAVVDQTRTVVEIGRDRAVNPRPVPSSASWRELGALGADPAGHLFVLDSGARQLLEYAPLDQAPVDPPRLVLDGTSRPDLAFDHAAEVVAQEDQIFLRMDDGSLQRFDSQGGAHEFTVRPADDSVPSVSAIAPDRSGGLYLADPAHARVLHTTVDGTILRQFRSPALAGVRQIQCSPDGRRMYGLVPTGVLVFDLPDDAPPTAT